MSFTRQPYTSQKLLRLVVRCALPMRKKTIKAIYRQCAIWAVKYDANEPVHGVTFERRTKMIGSRMLHIYVKIWSKLLTYYLVNCWVSKALL